MHGVFSTWYMHKFMRVYVFLIKCFALIFLHLYLGLGHEHEFTDLPRLTSQRPSGSHLVPFSNPQPRLLCLHGSGDPDSDLHTCMVASFEPLSPFLPQSPRILPPAVFRPPCVCRIKGRCACHGVFPHTQAESSARVLRPWVKAEAAGTPSPGFYKVELRAWCQQG